MKRFIIISIAVVYVLIISATNIKGKIETNDGDPISFATITALSSADSSFVYGAMSDENGCFIIESEDPDFLKLQSETRDRINGGKKNGKRN